MASPDPGSLGARAQWKSLLYFTSKRHIVPLLLASGCSLVCGIIVPVLAALLGAVFNEIARFGSQSTSATELMENVSLYCLYLLALGAATWVWQTAHFGLWVVCGELQSKAARENLFDALLHADLEWFEMTEDGVAALLPRVQTHIRDLQQSTSQPLGFTIQNLVAAVTSLILALYISWKLALVCLATAPVCAIIMAIVSRKIQPSMEAQQVELTKASKFASGAISSIETVKHFNGEASELSQYIFAVREAARWYLKEALACAIEIGCIHLLTFGMFVQGFWYGGYLVSRGELDAGQVLTTFWACFQSTQSIEDIIPQLMVLEKGRAAATFLKDTFEQAGKRRLSDSDTGKRSPMYCEGDIKFKNVTFTYPSQPTRPVLDNCSFFFPAGDMTFIVGKSGSGKSTIGNLLMQFYEPSSGEISIDGNSIETLDVNWIRNNITLVQQQSTLFNETIIKNICFGSRDSGNITEDDILTSIRFAGLSATVKHLSGGLDTVVGLHGNLLSGGQRQRVALARSRLRDTPILILDESTSALDQPSRTATMTALRSWRKGKTTIVITHDSSLIKEDEFVYVVNQGQVTRKGYKQIIKREAKDIFREPTSLDHQNPVPMTPVVQDFRERLRIGAPCPTPISPLFYQRRSIQLAPSMGSPTRLAELQRPPGTAHPASIGSVRRPSPINEEDIDSVHSPTDNKGDKQEAMFPSKLGPVHTQSHSEGYTPLSRIINTVISSLGLRDRFFLCLGFLCALCHAAATPVFSYMFSQLLAAFFLTESDSQTALKWIFAVVGVSAANGVASCGMHYLLELCSQSWVDYLRHEAMRRILGQPRHWFEKDSNDPPRLVNCLSRNVEEMKNLIGKFAGFILVAAVMIVMGVTWGSVICWKLTLVGAGCAPILYALTRAFDSVSHKWENQCGHAHEIMSDIFAETFLDIRTVRALTLESYLHRKHYMASWQMLTIGLKRACYTGFLFGLSDASIFFVYGLVFYYGAVLASSLEYSTPEILTVFSMLLFSMVNVKAVLALIPQISSSRDNATRVLELATLPDDTSHELLGKSQISHPVPIRFTNVSFSYPSRPENRVLRNVNILIKENMCTAIVGASGSGKSTIASLLLAFYPRSSTAATSTGGFSGSITLGGLNIHRAHVPTLRSRIAVVPQHPTLFPSTIRANISYGLDESSPLGTMADVRGAARAAGIHEFISSLPSGYDTVVGDGGLGLSGGQTQRLAIARALVRQPRVLVLDEVTSNLDRESAALIRKTLKDLMASRDTLSVIIITHAREMMEIADQVVVMDGGQVIAQGSCLELERRGGARVLRSLGIGSPLEDS